MITEIRKTISGTEYWDSEEKRSLFVPLGQELATGGLLDKGHKAQVVGGEINLDDMNAEELLSFAKDNDIDVSAKLKKEETIRNHIVEQLQTGTK
ncbi:MULTISPECIES: hypothetical protein [Bacillus cereus group]|uniref:hypothetical protein n=1 Tax=Bacillus cereus group TaxID=86661 RepID=UPI000BF0CA6F|nr:hypothetical protein [Bacillus toyonensis]PEO34052.1 hypothetical protein CN569_12200 [Bacillus toyonensis]PGE77025.1 hypothetical protein COM70_12730 [Bacillus toyonensis]